ncbi:sensor histidine kinase [Microlunatus speluncae]|uniref:sensor histidine kinase n=1 Tax=Microlunatus speluncae TaxID=2594267 RepID=UPI001375C88F|nr:sensor histidine kinase [Microlunatus speluncae]
MAGSQSFGAGEDPNAAPGARRDCEPARRWTLRRAWQNGLWMYLLGLTFLLVPVITMVQQNDPNLFWMSLLLGGLALLYLLTPWVLDLPIWLRVIFLVVFVIVLLVMIPFMEYRLVYYGIYVTILLATLMPWRISRATIPFVVVLIVGTGALFQDMAAVIIGATAMVIGFSIALGIENSRIERRLMLAEQRVAGLAVVAERERISRDLHDILGHSLTAISIKAGLARRLLTADPAAVGPQIAEVEQLARQVLTDLRSTVSGIREVRLATELASSRSVLAAAGIKPELPIAVPLLPDPISELFGYVVREAVTNVVRHSEASRCVILLDSDRIRVVDDGIGHRSGRLGSGLTGLTERVRAAGGRLTIEPVPGGGTTIIADLRSPDAPARETTLPQEVRT